MKEIEVQHDKFDVVMIDGRVRCIYLNDYRIVGSKPYVSERQKLQSFTVKAGEIAEHIIGAAPKPRAARRYPWVAGAPQTLMYLVLHCVESAGGCTEHFQHQLKTLGVDVSVKQVSGALQRAKGAGLVFNRRGYWQLTEKQP